MAKSVFTLSLTALEWISLDALVFSTKEETKERERKKDVRWTCFFVDSRSSFTTGPQVGRPSFALDPLDSLSLDFSSCQFFFSERLLQQKILSDGPSLATASCHGCFRTSGFFSVTENCWSSNLSLRFITGLQSFCPSIAMENLVIWRKKMLEKDNLEDFSFSTFAVSVFYFLQRQSRCLDA